MAAPVINGQFQTEVRQTLSQSSQGQATYLMEIDTHPLLSLTDSTQMCLVEFLNGQILHRFPTEALTKSVSGPPPSSASQNKKKHEGHQDDGRPYVKKPPNAFMLYMQGQRPTVRDKLVNRDSASVNTILAQRWKAMTKQQQAPYYEQAETERRLHAQRYPGWTCSNNYGRNKKRSRSQSCTSTNTGASTSQAGYQATGDGETSTESVQNMAWTEMVPQEMHVHQPHTHDNFATTQPQTSAVPSSVSQDYGTFDFSELDLLVLTSQDSVAAPAPPQPATKMTPAAPVGEIQSADTGEPNLQGLLARPPQPAETAGQDPPMLEMWRH